MYMFTILKKISVLLVIITAFVVGSFSVLAANGSSWEGGDPTLTTLGADEVNNVSVTLKAYYNSLDIDYNADDAPALYMEYGPNNNLSFTTPVQYQDRGSREVLFPIKNLVPNTQYTFRAILLYNNKKAIGETKSFYTTVSPVNGRNPADTTNSDTVFDTTDTNSSVNNTSNTSPSIWTWLFGTSSKKTTTDYSTTYPSSINQNGIKLSITDSRVRTAVNEKSVLVLEYTNNSSKNLYNTELEIALPAEYAFESSTKGVYNSATHSVVANILTLNKRESGKLSVLVHGAGTKSNKLVQAIGRLYHSEGVYTVYDNNQYTGGKLTTTGNTSASSTGNGSSIWGWFIIAFIVALLVFVAHRYFKKD